MLMGRSIIPLGCSTVIGSGIILSSEWIISICLIQTVFRLGSCHAGDYA
jgi:hypothetical protein